MEKDNIKELVKLTKKIGKPEEDFKQENQIYTFINALLILMVVVNLFSISVWGFNNSDFWYNESGLKYAGFNLNYFFIALPHLLWCNYVLLHYKKVYKYFDIDNRQKAMSIVIVFNLIFCILVGILYPSYWIISIGWGGLIQNIKTHLYSKDIRLSLVAREDFSSKANRTYVNMGITFIIGILFALICNKGASGVSSITSSMIDSNISFNREYLTLVYYICAGLYVYTSIALYNDHITDRKAAMMRAQLKRGVPL